ncbi:hypothetical protein Tco_0745812 [Tanacetum coccineum]
MYAMTCTRHDIVFAVGKLSRYTINPGTQHWQAIQQVLKYLKKTMDYSLTYSGYPLVLKGYTDTSWISNTEDNSSTSGWVFLLGGGAISWASKKQTCITGSTIEYEFVALAAAGLRSNHSLFPLVTLLRNHRVALTKLLAKAYSQMYNGKSRHLGVRHSKIRELITNGVISIEFVRSQQNLADHLTKGLARYLVIKSTEGIGLKSPMGIRAGLREHLAPMDRPDKIPIGDRGGFRVLFANRAIDCLHPDLGSTTPTLGENYINDDLTFVKPYTILVASFQTPLASKLVTQPKAPTNMKLKRKKILPSSKPKSSYKVRVILPKKHVAETQHTEEQVATADATKSLGASELAEEQVNQPKTAKAEKEGVKVVGFESIGDVTFEQIMDEYDQQNKAAQEKAESPYDTKSEIKIIKSFQAIDVLGSLLIHQGSQRSISDDLDVIDNTPKYDKEGDASDSGLRSMPDDDLASLTGFETPDSVDDDSKEGSAETFYASADVPAQSDPLGPLHEELCILNTKIDNFESIITKKVTDNVQSSVPSIVTNSLRETLPDLLLEDLKNTLPQLIMDSIKQYVLESIKERLLVCAAQVQQSL